MNQSASLATLPENRNRQCRGALTQRGFGTAVRSNRQHTRRATVGIACESMIEQRLWSQLAPQLSTPEGSAMWGFGMMHGHLAHEDRTYVMHRIVRMLASRRALLHPSPFTCVFSEYPRVREGHARNFDYQRKASIFWMGGNPAVVPPETPRHSVGAN
jgi:hypothetical protein